MSLIGNLTSFVGIRSEHLSHAATFFSGLSAANALSGSRDMALITGLAGVAAFAISRFKKAQEEEENYINSSDAFVKKFTGLMRKCFDHPNNKKSDINPNGFSDDAIADMHQVIDSIEKENVCKATRDEENNKKVRSALVGIQGTAEHLLGVLTDLEDIKSVRILFTVSSPLTPLCNAPNEKDKLAVKYIAHTSDEVATVSNRVVSLRKLLSKPDVLAHVEYPEGGRAARPNANDILNYDATLELFPNTLKDKELKNLKTLDPSLSGAIYFAQTKTGQTVIIIIKISQIIEVKQTGPVAFYLGSDRTPAVRERVEEVAKEWIKYEGTDPRSFVKDWNKSTVAKSF